MGAASPSSLGAPTCEMETLEDNVLSHKLDRLVGKTEQGRGQVPGSWSHEKLLSTGSSQCQNRVGSSGH